MKIIIKESKLPLLTENSTIQLQFINGCFYPIDYVSKTILTDKYGLERIPESGFSRWSPKLVRDGYKLAVSGYEPKPNDYEPPRGTPIGGKPKSTKNPC